MPDVADDELRQTSVVVLVPEAEGLVGGGAKGPAHVTVLHPFLERSVICGEVLLRVGRVAAGVVRFPVTFARTAWFGDQVVWLAPDPAEPFRRLTTGMAAAFPGFPPYGGEHPGDTPHLTLGMERPVEELRALERRAAGALPISRRVTHVQVVTGTGVPGVWETIAELPLG